MMRTQDQLNGIWIDAKAGRYKGVGDFVPEVVVDDEAENVMSLPNDDGTARLLFSRKPPNGPWFVLPLKEIIMSTEDECRKKFESFCKFSGVEWSLDWDKAGFYAELEADRAYTWFKRGYDRKDTARRKSTMYVSMTEKDREAVAAIQTAAQATARAVELAEQADYGDDIRHSLTEAQKNLVYALDTAQDRT